MVFGVYVGYFVCCLRMPHIRVGEISTHSHQFVCGGEAYFGVSAARPGRFFPSNISSEAPPPVDTCDMLGA